MKMLENKVPRDQIAKLLHMSPKTIKKIRDQGDHFVAPRTGRPSSVTKEMMSYMETNWAADASITDTGMMEMVNEQFQSSLSRTTVMRCRNRLKFYYRPPKNIQQLTDEEKEIRVAFCQWILEHESEVKNGLFTDESQFQKGPDNRWRRIKRGVMNTSCFNEKTKYPSTVMVWGGIAKDYRTELIRCSNGVNASEYIQILEKSGFIHDLNAKHGPGMWTFQQDGASCYTSEKVLTWLSDRQVCVLPGWPPNSPDLNPIEMLWGVMKRKLGGQWKGEDDVFHLLCQTWREISQSSIDSLVESFLFRCNLVLRLRGESATAYLSSHRPGPEIDLPDSSWSEQDDRILEAHVAYHGRKWHRIAALLGRRPNFLKHKYNLLIQRQRNEQHRLQPALPFSVVLDANFPAGPPLPDSINTL